ncbi:hypothetical protein SAMN05660464_2166 [Geodermatophilus dictyosporus]|uniref:Uncharacterized protein n=1 Tax=Geodermatophilus dictyosporus TaxID=1523247 RepID=A0A1I5MV70_9ACTN|nr:hypothetical protein [Geodermatophilus dictyosporus]SFP13435.1 hypothetical protein SAMN05660464_2166 [Geodermatophilus dictyosporus]
MVGSTRRRRVGVVLLGTAVLLGSGVATATWLASGTGSGAARAATVSDLVVSPGVPAGTLYPKPSGGYGAATTGTVVATVSNPNAFAVDLTTATLGTVTATPLSGRTCASGTVVPAQPSVPLSPAVRVPAGASGVQVTVPGALEMLPTAEDGCQGASFSVVLTLSGTLA